MNYDRFAPFYDATMGNRSDVIGLIRRQIDQYHPEATSMLELGCGTGEIMAGFPAFKRTGIDLSANMLQIAQRKLSKATFHRTDISSFSLNKKFDVVICVFDTINHLPDLAHWSSLFKSTREHLSGTGLFIFDMNTTSRMRALTLMPTYTQTIGNLTVDMDIEPVGPDSVDWFITVHEPRADGTIQIYEDTARERSYPADQVRTALTATGFTIINAFDSRNQPASDASDRIYFVCRPAPAR